RANDSLPLTPLRSPTRARWVAGSSPAMVTGWYAWRAGCADDPCPALCGPHERLRQNFRASSGAFDRVCGAVRRRVLSCAERHDAVAVAGDLSQPEADLRAGLCAHRAGAGGVSGDGVVSSA